MQKKITQQSVAEAYHPLFSLMDSEHNLILTVSEMDDIMSAVSNVNENLTELYRCVCDVEGCERTQSSGGMCWRETGYWSICSTHSVLWRNGEPQPKMKQESIDKEASRGADGILPVIDTPLK